MKVSDPTGIFQHVELLSPDVIKAQRMAELAQIAKYRAEKLQKYKDWSDPVKRAEMIKEMQYTQEAQTTAREDMAGKYIDDYRVRTVMNETFVPLKLNQTPITKPKLTRFERFKSWLNRFLSNWL